MFQRGIDKIKQKWAEDPVTMIVVGSLAITAVAKIIDSASAAQGRHAYAKQVEYRVNQKN
jgi:hypothetical protein